MGISLCISSHNKRAGRAILLQGMDLPNPQPTASRPLPPPEEKPRAFVYGSSADRHVFVEPKNTAGQACLKLKGYIYCPHDETARRYFFIEYETIADYYLGRDYT